MKHYFWQYFTIQSWFFILILSGCASVGTITGGPKDEIPPRLIYSSPKDQTINFQSQHLDFEFDEPIKLQALKKNLTITPNEELDFRFKTFKNKLTLDFETPFSEKTTYILDFGESISDMTEGNKLKNFKVAFSTGEYIDSLFIAGQVRQAETNAPVKNCRVGIYDVADTLDIDSGKPKYFAVTDTAGNFKITNVRPAKYKLYALQEAKKQDFKYNSSDEEIAFEPQEIELIDIGKVGYELRLTKYDLDTFKVKSARAKRHYFEVTANKTIFDYEVEFENSMYDSIFFYNSDKDILRFYNKNLDETDSVKTFISLTDSIGNVVRDTVFVNFNEKKSKTSTPFDFSIEPLSGTTFQKVDSFQLKLKFTAPVSDFFADSLTFKMGKDTIGNQIDSSKFSWNQTRTELQITNWFRMDSAQINFEIKDKMFTSFEGDSTTKKPLQYNLLNPENFGELSGEVRSDYPSFTFQLTDEKGNIEHELINPKKFKIIFVKPGIKKVRVLIDNNENGIWENGDFYERIIPEEVQIFDIEQEIKAGWTVEDIFIEIKKPVE